MSDDEQLVQLVLSYAAVSLAEASPPRAVDAGLVERGRKFCDRRRRNVAMKHVYGPVFFVLVVLVLSACSAERPGCPSSLGASVSDREFGVVFGGDERFAEARLTEIVAECIALRTGGDGGASEQGHGREVQISVTATVEYSVDDQEWFDSRRFGGPAPAAKFEALSASGVVLASARATFPLRRTGSHGTMSTTLEGLPPEVAARVSQVRVRWLYGQ